jgi:hypothetical protein
LPQEYVYKSTQGFTDLSIDETSRLGEYGRAASGVSAGALADCCAHPKQESTDIKIASLRTDIFIGS